LPQIEFITACDNETPNQMKIVSLDTGLGPIVQSHLKPTKGVTTFNKKLVQIFTTVSGNFQMPESLSHWKKEYKYEPINQTPKSPELKTGVASTIEKNAEVNQDPLLLKLFGCVEGEVFKTHRYYVEDPPS